MAMRSAFFFAVLAFLSVFSLKAYAADPIRIVALGDSLTAGYGMESGQDFATKLQEKMIAAGISARVDNAGVSGDTSAGGLSRVDWAVDGTPRPMLVIVALGANDMLRGIDPAVTQKNLAAILDKLKEKKIPVLLAGMKSPANLGPFFQGKFDRIYQELADEYDVPLYPFFLEGVAMKAEYNLPDGLHPNPKGIAIMVDRIFPVVEKTLQEK
ncbi:MAG TPA: arylesterase [Rhodospirillaceae bacterium]|nr:arylesterase [Rhodospirillaceae bacterium]